MARRSKLVIPFTRGLVTKHQPSILPEGGVPVLENWVPDGFGVKARRGWTSSGETDGPGTPDVIGMIVRPTVVIAHATATEIEIYQNNSVPPALSWELRDTIAVAPQSVAFAYGLDALLYTGPGFATIRKLIAGVASSVAGSPAGRCIAFHENRFFTIGTAANQTRLWFSDLGDYATWPANNWLEVGQEDGFPGNMLHATEDGLLIGKENGLWLLTGSGPDDFQLHRLRGGSSGGFATNTHTEACDTPLGVIIPSHKTIWLWDGGTPQPLSDALGTTVYMDHLPSAAYHPIDNTVYVTGTQANTGSPTRHMWACNLDTLAWRHEKLPANRVPSCVRSDHQNYLYVGLRGATAGDPPVLYRNPLGTALTPGTRDADFDETFTLKTPEMVLGSATAPAIVHHIYLQYRQLGGSSADAGLVATPVFDGVAGDADTIEAIDDPGAIARRERLDYGTDAYSFQLQLQHAALAAHAAACVYDIEEIIVEYEVEEDR